MTFQLIQIITRLSFQNKGVQLGVASINHFLDCSHISSPYATLQHLFSYSCGIFFLWSGCYFGGGIQDGCPYSRSCKMSPWLTCPSVNVGRSIYGQVRLLPPSPAHHWLTPQKIQQSRQGCSCLATQSQ